MKWAYALPLPPHHAPQQDKGKTHIRADMLEVLNMGTNPTQSTDKMKARIINQMILGALIASVAYLVRSATSKEIAPQNTREEQILPSFGVYTCKWCAHKDTIHFYWNLDTNTTRAQNIKAHGHK